MKKYHKNMELSYHMYLDGNNLYGWVMSQKWSADGFKWKENVSKFNQKFIKTVTKIVIKDIYLR